MNVQPFGKPPASWPPRLWPAWFRLVKPWRRKALRQQRITAVATEGLEHLSAAVKAGHGILLTPNHSFHWDSYCLAEAADPLGMPFYIMTAWQVFQACNSFDRWSLQRCGCFSVDREGTDVQAIKTAVDVLQNRPQPLVIFPEGDIYHTNDRVSAFRDGAAAMALMAARKATRPVVCIPTAIKATFVGDPTPALLETADRLERRLFWTPRPDLNLVERIYRIGEGLLALKEIEHLGRTQEGDVPTRLAGLIGALLTRTEARHGIVKSASLVPERVKEVRRRIITRRAEGKLPAETEAELARDLDGMFLVIQLYSYPGNYVRGKPTPERLAETLDKLEEDVLGLPYPTVKADRRVTVKFGAAIELPRDKDKRLSPADLTDRLEREVQELLDSMSADPALCPANRPPDRNA